MDVALGASPGERFADMRVAATEAGRTPLASGVAAFAHETMAPPCSSQAGPHVS